ncbi:MAG TPA: DUF1501 domain-containing protein [Planctomycetota bacterium]|nr:DUF1501 domain-containing protein [Planctomycetota bacterium]
MQEELWHSSNRKSQIANRKCLGPVTRRGLIKGTIAASLGFVLGRNFIPAAWAADDDTGVTIGRNKQLYVPAEGQAKHVILMWMNGGPSHIDTFDPKPGTPQAGGAKAIDASPDLQISANFPLLAKKGKYLCVLRGVHSKEGDHGQATYLMHTGYREQVGGDMPSIGSIVCAEAKNGPVSDVPSYVSLNGRGGGPGFYGPAYGPFQVNAGQPIQDLKAPFADKDLDARLKVLSQLDKTYSDETGAPLAIAHNTTYERVTRFSRSPLSKLFELKSLDAKAEPYGKSPFGRACYVAKRLVTEGNVRFVEINLDGWDLHSDCVNQSKQLCRQVDQPFARLLEELEAEGKLSETLIIWMGEFGRTPDLRSGGRDHYPNCFSVALAGGGVKGGQAVGKSNKSGHEPDGEGISVPDIFHTVCAACGIDATKFRESSDGRPVRIAERGAKQIPGVF